METIHRVGSLFFALVTGISLGALGLRLAFIIVTPLFILWFMSWDEKRYIRTREQQRARYVHCKFP